VSVIPAIALAACGGKSATSYAVGASVTSAFVDDGGEDAQSFPSVAAIFPDGGYGGVADVGFTVAAYLPDSGVADAFAVGATFPDSGLDGAADGAPHDGGQNDSGEG